MRYLRQSNNERVLVPDASALGVGGEAWVYAVPPGSRYAAKIYHRPTEAQARKLTAMLANPPDDPMAAQEHISIAWPLDLLRKMYGDQGFAGFLMPRVAGMRPLFNVYNPMTRRQECPLFNYLYLHRAARNVTAAVRALHSRGYVIGDINESNILVTETALVTLVDTDSFQVRDPHSGAMYRCPVGKPEFTPPELQGKNFRLVDRSPESDRFGLAVLIFQLLMEGAHPYSGVYLGENDPPPYDTRIREGHFTYGAKSTPYRPMPLAPPYNILHPDLRALFARCFEEGHIRPELRPDATTWMNALVRAEDALVTCAKNTQHRYGNHLDACPWCARTELLGGRDPFPLQAAKPYVRPGRDERRVERTVYNQAGSGVTLAASGAAPIAILTRTTGTQSSIQKSPPAANLPNWPLAPSAAYAPTGVHPLPNIPNYPHATWAAAICCTMALMVPGFHLLFGALAALTGLLGWRASHEGRKVALTAGVAGVLVSLVILANAAYRAYVPAELRIIEEKGPVRSVVFSPDSSLVAAATERNEDQRLISGEAALFDTQTGAVDRTFIFKGDVASVAFSQDGRLFAAGSGALLEPGSVKLWDTRDWRVRQVLTGFKSDVESVAFSPDSMHLVTGSRDQAVEIWDVQTGALLRLLDAGSEVFAVAYSPDGRLIAAGSGSSGSGAPGRVSVWDAQTGQLLWMRKGHSERCLSVAFSPDGRLLGSAGNDNTIRLWNPRTGNLEHMLEAHGVLMVCSVAFSPDSKTVACGGSDGSARLWDLSSGNIRRIFPTQGATVLSVAFTRNGKLLASGSQNGVVNVWRIK
jgi:hypothetical protein